MVASEQTCDVVVVGAGGAGLAAAIEARRAGADVVLLEKNPAPGGSTAWSVGSVTASGSSHQARAGVADDPASHWRDMAAFNGDLNPRDNPALRRVLADAMPETMDWLEAQGLRFFGPMPEPPHTRPRMHTVLPNARAYIVHLGRAARRLGVRVATQTRAVALVQEGGGPGGGAGGRVVAVDCETPDGPVRHRARRAVVLATGDFTNDPELKGRFMGPREARVPGVNETATGDGQKLALALGGRILNGDLALGPELRFIPPRHKTLTARLPPWRLLAGLMVWSMDHLPAALLRPFVMSFVTTTLAPTPALFDSGAILVNRRGERFAEETDAPAFALPDQPEQAAWIVLDARVTGLYAAWPHFVSTAPGVAYAYVDDYRRNRPDIFTAAPTLAALGGCLAMPAGALERTVADYNAARPATSPRPPVGEGPYVALGPVKAVFIHNEGGLAVDAEHRVLGADDRPIPGLYAAGATGQGGLLLKGHGHHLAWAFASGRRAGRLAAAAPTAG